MLATRVRQKLLARFGEHQSASFELTPKGVYRIFFERIVFWGLCVGFFAILIDLTLPPEYRVHSSLWSSFFSALMIGLPIIAFPAGATVGAAAASGMRLVTGMSFTASTVLLFGFAFLNNGYLRPLAADAATGNVTMGRRQINEITLSDIPAEIRETSRRWNTKQVELVREQKQKLLAAKQGGTERQWSAHERYTLALAREEEGVRRRINQLGFIYHYVLSWAVLAVMAAWAGFVAALWMNNIRSLMVRQIYIWTVGFILLFPTFMLLGYSGMIGRMFYMTTPFYAWAVTLIPLVFVLATGPLWLLVGRRTPLWQPSALSHG